MNWALLYCAYLSVVCVCRDGEWVVPGEARGLSVTPDCTVLVAIAGKCKLKELARQYLAENCGASCDLYRRMTVDSEALQSFMRRRLGRHDFDYICNCLVYQVHCRRVP